MAVGWVIGIVIIIIDGITFEGMTLEGVLLLLPVMVGEGVSGFVGIGFFSR